MKKILFFILLIVSIQSFAQTGFQHRTVNERIQGKFMVDSFFNLPRFTDTTAANLHKAVDSCGALFYSYSDTTIWVRNCNPKRWSRISGGTNLLFEESVIKSNDSTFLSGEKTFPPLPSTVYSKSLDGDLGFHLQPTIDFDNANHHYILKYDTTGTFANGIGFFYFVPDTSGVTTGGGTDCITEYLKFKTGVTTDAPVAGDSVLVNAGFADKWFEVKREEQWLHYDTLSGYTVHGDTLFFHPPLVANERVDIQLKDSSCFSALEFEPPPSPVDMDFDYVITVTESPANQWNYGGLFAYAQNTLTSLTGDGYFQWDTPSNAMWVSLDDDPDPTVNYETGSTINWDYNVFVFSGDIYVYEQGDPTSGGTNLGAVGSYTKFRIKRTGTTVKAQASTDGVNFSDIHTYGNSSTGNLYVKTQVFTSSGTLTNPITLGFE